MGAKQAGIHFRSDDREYMISYLKSEFDRIRTPDQKDLAGLQLIQAIAGRNIRAIADETERAQKEAMLNNILAKTRKNLEAANPAVIVLREHFVSLYWYDRIRPDNFCKYVEQYAQESKVPVLGAAIYDDSDFTIRAACRTAQGAIQDCRGAYLFSENDVYPADAAELCRILAAPFLLPALKEVMACESGWIMAERFEEKTGLNFYMDEDMCAGAGMKEICRWACATVFCPD